MDKSDFKIALKEIPDNKWSIYNDKSLYYRYDDSTIIHKDQETYCTLDIKSIKKPFSPYLILQLVNNYKYPNSDYISSQTIIFSCKIFDPIFRYKYRKIFKKILIETKKKRAIKEKMENLKLLPKSLIRSLNIERYLED